jgi:hypothetical protein
MLGRLRRLVYKMGFDPKPGSILFSPSLYYMRLAGEAVREAVKTIDQGRMEVQSRIEVNDEPV